MSDYDCVCYVCDLHEGEEAALREKVAKLEAELHKFKLLYEGACITEKVLRDEIAEYEHCLRLLKENATSVAAERERNEMLEATVVDLRADVRELTAERDEARTKLRDGNLCNCGELIGVGARCFACFDAEVAFETERCAKAVEAVSAAISGPEQDALQWYARNALQRAAEAIRRGE